MTSHSTARGGRVRRASLNKAWRWQGERRSRVANLFINKSPLRGKNVATTRF